VRGEADYAKGNRFRDVEALRAMPRLRLVGNGVLSFLTKLVSGYWSIFDPTNAYTAIRGEMLRRLNFANLAKRYFFETSMLIELNIQGAVVRDVDMPARYGDETSSLRVRSVAAQFPGLLVRGLVRRFFWRYMIRDFNALTLCVLAGVPSIIFGVSFGAYHWWRSIATGVPATTGTVILATLPIILGVQFLLVAFVLDMLYQPSHPPASPRPAAGAPDEVSVSRPDVARW
jgi:dolichol-phosphate mannosyltransferase